MSSKYDALPQVRIDPENFALLRRVQLRCRYKVSLARLVNDAIANYSKTINTPVTKKKHAK